MNTILTLVRKDFTLFLKDKTAIALTFLVPFFVIYIIGNIFSGMNDDNNGLSAKIKLAAYNESGADAASVFIAALDAEESIDLVTTAKNAEGEAVAFTRESIRQGIVDHDYNFAIIIPQNYLKEEGVGLRLEFLTNPKNQIETQIVNGLIQKAVFTKLPLMLAKQLDTFQLEQMGEEKYEQFLDGLAALVSLAFDDLEYDEVRQQMGLENLAKHFTEGSLSAEGSEEGAFLESIIEIETDQVFGKEVKNPYLTRMIGGYAIMFLLFATTGSASSLFEERNEGIFLRLLSMPVKRTHILWSKYLFNTLLGILQALVLFIASSFLFEVEVFENLGTLFVVSIFASAACTSFGMFLSSISKTPQQANGFGTLLIISMSALGGAWFPLSMMPDPMQIIGKFTIVYWGVEAYLGALWEDAGLFGLLPYLAVLAGIALALNLVSSWRFRTGDLFR